MARLTPLWQQAATFPARLDRQLIASAFPSGGASAMTIAPVANTMQSSVGIGWAAVPLAPGNGSALCVWDAPEIVTHPASPGSGTNRVDLIVVQVRDPDLDAGANNDFVVSVVAGTPAATNPAVPAVPANALGLAQVLVIGASANLNGATVTRATQRLGTDPAWITMTPLQNGWAADGSVGPPQYRRINGLVYLRGGVNGATMNSVMFTLPSGYRPSATMHFLCRATSSITPGQVQVQAPGAILPNVSGTPTGSQFVALAGIVFDADGT